MWPISGVNSDIHKQLNWRHMRALFYFAWTTWSSLGGGSSSRCLYPLSILGSSTVSTSSIGRSTAQLQNKWVERSATPHAVCGSQCWGQCGSMLVPCRRTTCSLYIILISLIRYECYSASHLQHFTITKTPNIHVSGLSERNHADAGDLAYFLQRGWHHPAASKQR